MEPRRRGSYYSRSRCGRHSRSLSLHNEALSGAADPIRARFKSRAGQADTRSTYRPRFATNIEPKMLEGNRTVPPVDDGDWPEALTLIVH